MARIPRISIVCCALLLGVSCARSNIRADDFERACHADSECMLIETGNRCDCTCDRVAAINVKDRAQYERAWARAFDPDRTCDAQCKTCQQIDAVAVCQDQVCTSRPRDRALSTPLMPGPADAAVPAAIAPALDGGPAAVQEPPRDAGLPAAAGSPPLASDAGTSRPGGAAGISPVMSLEQLAAVLHPGFTADLALRFNGRTGELTVVDPKTAGSNAFNETTNRLVGGTVVPRKDGGTAAVLIWKDGVRSPFFEAVLTSSSGTLLRTRRLVDVPSCGDQLKVSVETDLDALAPNGAPLLAVRFACRVESKMSCYDLEKLVVLLAEGASLRATPDLLVSACNRAKDPNEAYPECLETCPKERLDRAALEVLPGATPRLKKTSSQSGDSVVYEWKNGSLQTSEPDPIHLN